MSVMASYEQLVQLLASHDTNANTRRAHRADLDQFAVWCALHDVSPLAAQPAEIEQYRTDCEAEGLSPATLARRLSTLRTFFAFAVERGSLSASPADDVRGPAVEPSPTHTLDAAQTTALLGAAHRLGGRADVLVSLLLLDGLKLAEALAADADDLDESYAHISVDRRQGSAVVALQPETSAALSRYLAGREAGPLLQSGGGSQAGQRLTRFGADYLIKQAADDAALPFAVSANTLRRSHIAAAHHSGQSVDSIRLRIGHRDSRTTRRHLD